ncbi:hypothetical protein [Rossellomorea sp. LjRoot5]|uniref:hypothetical protein n=1 Tax=Rossellomorea sp. LjRoot5 TaxID=3342331 RepID=UPI003ECF700F
MPKKSDEHSDLLVQKNAEIEKLEQMLAAVLHYLSDDEIEEIDIEYLLSNTDNLREWWGSYREKNKKKLEDEIKGSLNRLSLEELEHIREQIKNKNE